MRSRFPPHRHPLWVALGLFAAGSCDKQETYVTPLQVVPFENSAGCIGREGVNALSVEILRYGGSVDPTKVYASECRRCGSDFPCPIIASRCLCVGTRHTIEEISEGLSNLRFDDITPDERICLRLVALRARASDPTKEGPDKGPGSPCDVARCLRDPQDKRVRLCILSDVSSVTEAANPIVLRHFFCGTFPALQDLDCKELRNLCIAKTSWENCLVFWTLFCSETSNMPFLEMTPWQALAAASNP